MRGSQIRIVTTKTGRSSAHCRKAASPPRTTTPPVSAVTKQTRTGKNGSLLVTEDALSKHYVRRARSAFYSSPVRKKPLSTFDAFRRAAAMRPKAARAWLDRLSKVSSKTTESIIAEVPTDWISPMAAEFAHQMLTTNQRILLAA